VELVVVENLILGVHKQQGHLVDLAVAAAVVVVLVEQEIEKPEHQHQFHHKEIMVGMVHLLGLLII